MSDDNLVNLPALNSNELDALAGAIVRDLAQWSTVQDVARTPEVHEAAAERVATLRSLSTAVAEAQQTAERTVVTND